MQNSGAPSLATILSGLAAIATFLGIPLSYLLGKRKQSAEVSQADALTRKTDAETRQIDSQIALKAFERLDDLEVIIRKQALEDIDNKREIADLKWKLNLADQREKVLNETIKQAHAELQMLRRPLSPGHLS